MRKALAWGWALTAGCTAAIPGEQDVLALKKFDQAVALMEDGSHAEAAAGFEEALVIRSRMFEGYERLAQCYRAMGRPDRARGALERGVRACGKRVEMALPLAREYAQMGRTEDALALYREMITEHPELKPELEELTKRPR